MARDFWTQRFITISPAHTTQILRNYRGGLMRALSGGIDMDWSVAVAAIAHRHPLLVVPAGIPYGQEWEGKALLR